MSSSISNEPAFFYCKPLFNCLILDLNKMSELLEKIKTKKAKIGVIGLGYVGLPLSLEFARSGYCVTGIDKSKECVEFLSRGKIVRNRCKRRRHCTVRRKRYFKYNR